MNVLQISSHAQRGGAARIAWYLFDGLRLRGVAASMAVGSRDVDHPDIFQIDHAPYWRFPAAANALKWAQIWLGWERYDFPASAGVPHLPPAAPDILHAHNLVGYFDLRALARLSQAYPTLLTLHDAWPLTGHCAYPVTCRRWQTGCGRCPDLQAHPPARRDATAFNWKRKKEALAPARLYLAAPSRWLLEMAQQSPLMASRRASRVIPNGVDTAIYRPAPKDEVRRELGIPEAAFVLLYVVASQMKTNSYKDYPTIAAALDRLQAAAPPGRSLVFIGLGQAGERQTAGSLEKRFIAYQSDLKQVAKYYQAADVYIHAARADNFPNVVLEALACGAPVVATAVGGIPEQIIDGETGYLAPAGDAEALAQRCLELLQQPERQAQMGQRAAQAARRRFSIDRMLDDYLDYYAAARADFAASQGSSRE